MTHDVWTWGTKWIIISLIGLILIALQGALVGGLDLRSNSSRHCTRTVPARWAMTLVA